MPSIKTKVALKNYSNFKIGGSASYFTQVFSKQDVIDVLKNWKEMPDVSSKQLFILGGGTNILFSDNGYEGLVVLNSIKGIRGIKDRENEKEVIAQLGAGTLISELLDFCIQNSLSGLEWAGGLPGTIGGAVRGNAGAFKGEIKDSVEMVESISIKTFETKSRNNAECKFDYRSSVFKTGATDEMIISIELKLLRGDKREIEKLTQEKIDYRNQKHPMDLPSIGSTFKNVQLDSLTPEQKKA